MFGGSSLRRYINDSTPRCTGNGICHLWIGRRFRQSSPRCVFSAPPPARPGVLTASMGIPGLAYDTAVEATGGAQSHEGLTAMNRFHRIQRSANSMRQHAETIDLEAGSPQDLLQRILTEHIVRGTGHAHRPEAAAYNWPLNFGASGADLVETLDRLVDRGRRLPGRRLDAANLVRDVQDPRSGPRWQISETAVWGVFGVRSVPPAGRRRARKVSTSRWRRRSLYQWGTIRPMVGVAGSSRSGSVPPSR